MFNQSPANIISFPGSSAREMHSKYELVALLLNIKGRSRHEQKPNNNVLQSFIAKTICLKLLLTMTFICI